jgi:hypothetical protein
VSLTEGAPTGVDVRAAPRERPAAAKWGRGRRPSSRRGRSTRASAGRARHDGSAARPAAHLCGHPTEAVVLGHSLRVPLLHLHSTGCSRAPPSRPMVQLSVAAPPRDRRTTGRSRRWPTARGHHAPSNRCALAAARSCTAPRPPTYRQRPPAMPRVRGRPPERAAPSPPDRAAEVGEAGRLRLRRSSTEVAGPSLGRTYLDRQPARSRTRYLS